MAIASRIWDLVRGRRRAHLGACTWCLEPVGHEDAVAGTGSGYLHRACAEARRRPTGRGRFTPRAHLALAQVDEPARYTGD